MVKRKVSEFVETWKGNGDEKQDTQRFWMDLFQKVLGIEYPAKHLMFEKKVRLEDSTRYIDAYIPETKVLIEQKGMKINLSKEELQSGGASLTPYNQARRYDNNFPWPTPTDAQKIKIEKTAQAILDARNIYPDCSLADLYDEVTMPPELRKAHQENDKAVMEAYGFNPRMTETEIVAKLFRLYQELTVKERSK